MRDRHSKKTCDKALKPGDVLVCFKKPQKIAANKLKVLHIGPEVLGKLI